MRAAPTCDHDAVCITCGDTAVAMTVTAVDAERALALCANAEGEKQTVETALVGAVGEGDALLVHAGTALQRLGLERLDAGRCHQGAGLDAPRR